MNISKLLLTETQRGYVSGRNFRLNAIAKKIGVSHIAAPRTAIKRNKDTDEEVIKMLRRK